MRHSVVCVLGVVLLVSSGCGSEVEDNGVKSVVLGAAEKLRANDAYVISSVLSDNYSQFYSVDVKSGGAVYTQFPVDDEADGAVGTLPYGYAEEMQYSMSEYQADDAVYVFSGDELYVMPEGYRSWVAGKEDMFVSQMANVGYGFMKEEPMYQDGGAEVACYSFKVPAADVAKVLGASTYGMYASVLEEHRDDNIGKLCQYYLDDYDFVMKTSDANVYVGVDADGLLCYCMVEVGGLGQRMYLTKMLYDVGNAQPDYGFDFSEAVEYSKTLSDFADYVAECGGLEEAYKAMEMEENDGKIEEVAD